MDTNKNNKTQAKKRAPWLTQEVISLTRLKASLWKRNQASKWKCSKLVQEYQIIRNKVKKPVPQRETNLKTSFQLTKITLLAYVNYKQSTPTGIQTLVKKGKLVYVKLEIANILNKQFESAFTYPESQISSLLNARTKEKLDNIKRKQYLIFWQKQTLTKADTDPNKKQECDLVHPYVLKEAALEFSEPLPLIFNHTMRSGEVQKVWLDDNVTPIFKKGSTTDPNNYRRISLTSVICKILEKLVKKELLAYFTNHKLLCDQQHGFVPHKPCRTNLLESIDLLTHLKANKLQVFLDFSKAFDKVYHPSLLEKLSKYCIAWNLLKWLGEDHSDWIIVMSGVPQG